MRIPDDLARVWQHEPDWLGRLPQLVQECAAQWRLELEEPFDTPHSFVVPAGDWVLKINAPSHSEADYEADALACWQGDGAVRLVDRDDSKRALLVERCRPGTTLDASTEERCSIVAELLPRLWVRPEVEHPFRLMVDECQRWAETVPRFYEAAGRPFDRGMVELALEVFRSCDAGADLLVNQDLHGGNILEAEREPWLVIDPKPAIGEREVSAVGLLRGASDRGGVSEVRLWLDHLQAFGLDRERLRGWGVAHTLAWGWDEGGRWLQSSVTAAEAIFAA